MNILLYIVLGLFCFSTVNGNNDFGYISYSTTNIGDDIQEIAAKKFLPENSIPIDREFIAQFKHSSPVKTIVNGWYMHTKDCCWYCNFAPAPEKSWPPSPSIDPLLISIYLNNQFLPTAFSEEGLEYLKQHGPVGARDYHTLKELQKRNIPSYFSGCLTLTLENPYEERDDIIYAVDLDAKCLNFLRSKTKYEVKVLHHDHIYYTFLNHEQRLKYAEKFLEKYRRAKCVITIRLHASMPCLALETPVLLINDGICSRYDGLRELARHCTREEFLSGEFDFDFDDPPENPKTYLPLREQLIETVTNWVEKRD